MKFLKVVLILVFIITLFAIIFYSVFFDRTDYNTIENSSTKEITLIQEEIDNFKEIEIDNVAEKSDNFNTNIVIHDFSDGRISFEINVFEPKTPMYQVTISAFLGDEVLNYINTPHSLVSNIIAVQNAGKPFDKNFNLIPNGDIKGISTSSNLIYFESATLNDVLEVLPYIVIKYSWLDENNNSQTEYVKYTKDKYIIMQK